MTTSARIIIFEGVDGAGKTTAAKRCAAHFSAAYVHCGVFQGVTHGLARLYVEAMLPALQGYQDVVLDRSWFSEAIYGQVCRNNKDRLGPDVVRMLNRLAWRCGAVVVWCQPPWKTVKASYCARRRVEYVLDLKQLRQVYLSYKMSSSQKDQLLGLDYNYVESQSVVPQLGKLLQTTAGHPLAVRSAGNWRASVCLVGEGFTAVTERDSSYQVPFVSFVKAGCSLWLTAQLREAGIPEAELCWVNANQPLELLPWAQFKLVVALGGVADQILTNRGITHTLIPHPQYWKRFHAKQPYPLVLLLQKEYLK